jgi:hypothetical protein
MGPVGEGDGLVATEGGKGGKLPPDIGGADGAERAEDPPGIAPIAEPFGVPLGGYPSGGMDDEADGAVPKVPGGTTVPAGGAPPGGNGWPLASRMMAPGGGCITEPGGTPPGKVPAGT